MKSVGIITTIYDNNFGESLQAYAMRKAVLLYAKDCRAEIVPFMCGSQSSITKPGFEDFYDKLVKKNELFNEFRINEMGVTASPLLSLDGENTPIYDRYIFGSDQIWNTDVWEVPEFFGSFVPQDKIKIAYAASVGVKPDNPGLRPELFRKYVPTFDYLSVRERIHCEYVQQFTDKQVHYVADPTMLLNRDIYESLLPAQPPAVPGNKYLFYYQPHSADGAIVNLVNKIARMNHMDVVHTFADIPKVVFPYQSVSARFAGPREFLYYIKNSSMVITRSFHAVVFSILFEKPFYAYVDKKSGSRFESLLETLGLEDRLIYDYMRPENVTFQIDYDAVNRKLAAFRKDSLDYLLTALQ